MDFKKLQKEIAEQISRIEANPKFYLEAQLWNEKTDIEYNIGFYPRTKLGEEFKRTAINTSFVGASPKVLIALVKSSADEILKESYGQSIELTISE